MNQYRNTFSTFILLLIVSPLAQAADCDQVRGHEHIQLRDLDKAYDHLRDCEYDSEVTGQTLVHLAMLTASLDYEVTDQEQALKRMWELLHRAAARGHVGALEALIGLYQNGEEQLKVRGSVWKSQCLERLKYSGQPPDGKRIQKCLNEG